MPLKTWSYNLSVLGSSNGKYPEISAKNRIPNDHKSDLDIIN